MTEPFARDGSIAAGSVDAAVDKEFVVSYNDAAAVRRRRRKAVAALKRPVFPVETVRVAPAVHAAALRAAGGDASRLRLHRDGSVTVVNQSAQEE